MFIVEYYFNALAMDVDNTLPVLERVEFERQAMEEASSKLSLNFQLLCDNHLQLQVQMSSVDILYSETENMKSLTLFFRSYHQFLCHELMLVASYSCIRLTLMGAVPVLHKHSATYDSRFW